MSVFYVSQQNGDDSNNGTTVALAKATIAGGVAVMSDGDHTLNIGPGTYREVVTLGALDGTSWTAMMKIFGDPTCEFLTSDNPGIVRITGCADGNERPLVNGSVISCWGRDYIHLKNFHVDGSSNGRGILFGNTGNYTDPNRVENCVVSNCKWGFGYVAELINCLAFGNSYGGFIYPGYADKCISVAHGAGEGFLTDYYHPTLSPDQILIKNCVAIGGSYGFRASAKNTVPGYFNNTAIGCYYGYRDIPRPSRNNVAIGCNRGVYQGTATDYMLAQACYLPYTSMTSVGAFAYYNGPSGSNPSHGTFYATGSNIWGYDLYNTLIRALAPTSFIKTPMEGWGDANVLTGSFSASNLDILGQPRQMMTGTESIDIGAYAISSASIDYTTGRFQTNPPGITFHQSGMKQFYIPMASGSSRVIKVSAMCSGSTDLAMRPQIQISGSYITDASDTSTAATSSWQVLSASCTALLDDEITLKLYARASGSGETTYFSDIQVT